MMFSDRFAITLSDFNQEFFDSLDDNYQIKGPALGQEQYFHTILVDGLRAGVVGYLPPRNVLLDDAGFVQIVLAPEFRGRGLIGPIYELLAERHGLKTLYGTVTKKNTLSLRAHEKIGFRLLSEEKMADLRRRGLLGEDEVRLEKEIS